MWKFDSMMITQFKFNVMTNEEHIEEILIEASAYGLRDEVHNSAKQFMEEGYDRMVSFEMAFAEWIK